MSSRGPQKRRTDTQIEILCKLATEGNRTISQLSKKPLNKYRTNFVKSIQVLEGLNIVKKTETRNRKGMKNPYKITEKGIEILSKDKRIKLEKFWEIAFLMFDEKTSSTKYPIEQFFTNYEKNVLGYDLDFASINPNVYMRNFGISYPITQKPTTGISMLIALSINKSMTKNTLVKYIKNKNPIKIKIEENADGYFRRLLQDKLVAKTTNDKNPKYRTTILGFLIMMKFLRISQDDLHNNHNINTGLIIKKIIKNSQFNLPFISKYWDTLRNIIDEPNAVMLFDSIMDGSNPISGSIQVGGIKELLMIERMMSETHQKAINKELKVGVETLSKLARGKKPSEEIPSKAYNRLLFLGVLSGHWGENLNDVIKLARGKKFSLDDLVEKAISNRVSFEFFIYLVDRVIREKEMAGNIEELDRIGKLHYSKVQKWNNFQNNNNEFREWYASWIKQLLKFEEKNIKIISKTNLLDV